jgi:hypothetical protein
MIEQVASAEEWAQYGLAGLVIMALFIQTAWFLVHIKGKDKSHQEFISEILTNDREERQEDRREHRATTNRLASALTDLTNQLRHQK